MKPDGPHPLPPAPPGVFRVWAHDAFAREDYFVGEFASEAEARAAADALGEWCAQNQDEPLRDRVWIEPPDAVTKPT